MTQRRNKKAGRHPAAAKRQRGGEKRLVMFAVAIIAVAAASIGAMLALQYRAAEPEPEPETLAAAPAADGNGSHRLPVYEEALEPAAVAPLPAPPVIVPKTPAVPGPGAPDAPLPAWQRNAVAATAPAGDTRPMIAVVIDDLGVDRARSARTLALPGPLTMAWLPYAPDLEDQTAAAHAAGHELLVHVPMDPRNRAITDPGPNALLVGLDGAELARRIDWNLSRFGGYVGINNHMGSRFTADAEALVPVMDALRRRGLIFLDSRTSARSAALPVARREGVPVVARDIFIDHERTPEAVGAALAEVEAVARRNGHAIAIGHPRDLTIDALAEWLPQLARKGFRQVPLSAIVAALHPAGD